MNYIAKGQSFEIVENGRCLGYVDNEELANRICTHTPPVSDEAVEAAARALCRLDIKNRFVAEDQRNTIIEANWRAYITRAVAVLTAASTFMRGGWNNELEKLWHTVECEFGQAYSAKTAYEHGYFWGRAKNAFEKLRHHISDLAAQDAPGKDAIHD